jgi:hypothetical protein
MTTQKPKGADREVSATTRVTIGGASISYVALFAAVLGVAALIPVAIMTTGSGMPLSEFLYALTGIVLGPVGGFVAGLVGGFIGLAIAPHTAPNGILSPLIPALGAMATGYYVQRNKNKWYGVAIIAFFLLIFSFKGIFINHVNPLYWLFLAVIVAWITLILAVTPLTVVFSNWLRSANFGKVFLGLLFVCFMGSSTAMIVMNGVGFYLYEVPNDIWPLFPMIVTPEILTFTVGGAILGTAIIAGLRRLRLVRPTEGAWYPD